MLFLSHSAPWLEFGNSELNVGSTQSRRQLHLCCT
jgi:hypothetical protein